MGLLNGHLHNYLTETPEKNLDVINGLFTNDFIGVDVVIIRSQQGCGGTHLLQQIGKELINENKTVCCISGEKFVNIIKKEKEALEVYLHKYSYFLVDDLDYLLNHIDCLCWLKSFLENYIEKGGRFIFSHTLNKTVDEWLLHIGKYKATEITSTYPSVEILKQIALEQLPTWIVDKHFDEVYGRSSCTREFLGILISYDARYKLGLTI